MNEPQETARSVQVRFRNANERERERERDGVTFVLLCFVLFNSNFTAFIRSVRQVLDWLATSGESHLSLHPVRDIKTLGKDVALEWLEDNKKFREEAKVRLLLLTLNRHGSTANNAIRGFIAGYSR